MTLLRSTVLAASTGNPLPGYPSGRGACWRSGDTNEVVLHASELYGHGLGEKCDAMWQLTNPAAQVGCEVGWEDGRDLSLTVGKTGTIELW